MILVILIKKNVLCKKLCIKCLLFVLINELLFIFLCVFGIGFNVRCEVVLFKCLCLKWILLWKFFKVICVG